jgi:hypothetical protein
MSFLIIEENRENYEAARIAEYYRIGKTNRRWLHLEKEA